MPQIKKDVRHRVDDWVRQHYHRISLANTPIDEAAENLGVGRFAVIGAKMRYEDEMRRHAIMPPVRWVGRKAVPPATPKDVSAARRMAPKLVKELREWYSESSLAVAFARLCEQRKGFALGDDVSKEIVSGLAPAKECAA